MLNAALNKDLGFIKLETIDGKEFKFKTEINSMPVHFKLYNNILSMSHYGNEFRYDEIKSIS